MGFSCEKKVVREAPYVQLKAIVLDGPVMALSAPPPLHFPTQIRKIMKMLVLRITHKITEA